MRLPLARNGTALAVARNCASCGSIRRDAGVMNSLTASFAASRGLKALSSRNAVRRRRCRPADRPGMARTGAVRMRPLGRAAGERAKADVAAILHTGKIDGVHQLVRLALRR